MIPPDVPGLEFTPDERRRLLQMLEDHERIRWLWGIIVVVAKTITAVSAALIALKYGILEMLKWRPLH